MKKLMIVVLAMLVMTSLAMAQFTPGTYASPVGGVTGGIQFNIDKLGAHQNGGRGCVGCHAPHSGARGNGGTLQWNGTDYVSVAVEGDSGDLALWGQDLGPIYNATLNFPTGDLSITETSPERQITGVAMCLSCHDGNVAKGAMMTNQSFEQSAGLLPAGYGEQPIPTLLGADGGTFGNYENDHPVGPGANLGTLGGIKASTNLLAIATNSSGAKYISTGTSFTGSALEEFRKNYGLPTITGARVGAGWAVDDDATSVDQAYVVCTTCHTPHSMYTASASSTNPIATLTKGTFPSYFFIAAPYNPGADVAGGTKASSATQFCRQCHFTGAGGSNEGSGISIPTAF
ncbi:MAG TPA: hypothetical protein VN577_12665 [Terriglobales bacterium]|nr:hypothetical protein [Terriglobales bacterium]